VALEAFRESVMTSPLQPNVAVAEGAVPQSSEGVTNPTHRFYKLEVISFGNGDGKRDDGDFSETPRSVELLLNLCMATRYPATRHASTVAFGCGRGPDRLRVCARSGSP
jgi:hypothetical protein